MNKRFSKLLLTLFSLFVLSILVLAGSVVSLNTLEETTQNGSVIYDGENSYSSIEEYQAATKQDKKGSTDSSFSDDYLSVAIETHGDHSDWNELNENVSTLTEGNWFLSESYSTETSISIGRGASVTLCLNGYTLSVDALNGISISNGSWADPNTFILDDCSQQETGRIEVSYDREIPRGIVVRNSASLIINRGTIAVDCSVSSTLVSGIYVTSASTISVDITMNGGTISVNNSQRGANGIYVDSLGTNSTVTLNISGGSILATSGTYSSDAYGIYASTSGSLCVLNLNVTGGTIVASNNNGGTSLYGFYIFPNISTANININGGYHDYGMCYVDVSRDNVSFIVNAGYFTDDAYGAISTYIPDTSTLKTFSTETEGKALDIDYDYNYPNAVYLIGSSPVDLVGDYPNVVCYGTDIYQYLAYANNTITYIFSYTSNLDVVLDLPTAIGAYQINIAYSGEHVSNDGRAPKEYYGGNMSSFYLTISDHDPSDTYSYDNTHHWKECINTYCDQVYTEASGYEEHILDGDLIEPPTETEGGQLKIYCTTCEWAITVEIKAINEINLRTDTEYVAESVSAGCDYTGNTNYYYVYGNYKFFIYQEIIPATGHNYTGNYYFDDDTGHYQRCSRCLMGTSPIEAHDKTSNVTKEPTTSESGELELSCTVCDWFTTIPLDPLDEVDPDNDPEYEVVRKEPNCTEEGSVEYYYVYSEDEKYLYHQETLSALGHEYSSGRYTYDSTHHYEYCIRCEEYNSEGDEHDKTSEVLKEPIGSEKGELRIYCQTCEWSITEELNPIGDIDPDSDPQYEIETINPTCTDYGSYNYYYIDGEERFLFYQVPIEPLGHNYSRGEYYSDENGHYEYCIRCDATDEIEEHDFDDVWVPSQEDGMEERDCNTCGYTQTRAVEEEPVDPEDPENPSEPTDPEDPENPNEPIDPTDPTDSDDPENPSTHIDPTDDPGDTGNPADPTDTNNPDIPSYTDISVTTTNTFVLHFVYIIVAVICLFAGYKAKIDAQKDVE